ncbi:hypothetical protein I7I53_04661 [Histoplasma capsulatum var. duboisii H88]|uniref:Uncharacterized protein n=2 Tax=Ajellomyces capsulatus TaxID=5037 RepID=A0A8H7YCV4_AJECA|nr:hypothetical protein I7I52_12290 [Histoplasma capsulatum]QSS56447.1 hypothetical protein I7I53_04661 [Histoplasma capsulatum var. duboisii H88]QSS71292.1 hypothetical protein I7I50_02076 [Histoplasma capsulatum G186AR]
MLVGAGFWIQAPCIHVQRGYYFCFLRRFLLFSPGMFCLCLHCESKPPFKRTLIVHVFWAFSHLPSRDGFSTDEHDSLRPTFRIKLLDVINSAF